MFAEYKNMLRKMRGTIIGWSIGLLLYDWMMSSFYSSIGEMADEPALWTDNPCVTSVFLDYFHILWRNSVKPSS